MNKYERMIESIPVMPNLSEVHSLNIDANNFFATLKNGETVNMVDVSGITKKTDAFSALCFFSAERMRKEQMVITSINLEHKVLP